jgi:hypothetical protein
MSIKLAPVAIKFNNNLDPKDRTWSLSNPTTEIIAVQDPLGRGTDKGWYIKVLYASKGTHGGKAVANRKDCKVGLVHVHAFKTKKEAEAMITTIMSTDREINPNSGFKKVKANNPDYWLKVRLDPAGDRAPRPHLWMDGKWDEIEAVVASPSGTALPF